MPDPANPARITLKQVAAEAGVHVSTAWRALKNDTYVDPAKRARIRAIAKRLAYVPDPMLTALSHYRRKQHTPAYRSTFAWVNTYPERNAWQNAENIRAYFEGATAFAASMGYKLEEFWLTEPGLNAKRARGVLLARNIRGLIFAPQPDAKMELTLQMEALAGVSIGYSLLSPRLHIVANHQHSSTLTCLRELCRAGHSRIGMVSASETLRRAEHNFEAPYFLFQDAQPENRKIPFFTIDGRDEPAVVNPWRDRFLAWFDRHRPTAIISTVSEVKTWLEGAAVNVPNDVSLATLSRIFDPGWSGIDQQEKEIGARAVELLISLFQSGERGVPATPLRLLVEGRWIDAGTVKKIGPPMADLLKRLS
ncbi:MAG: substrate-binding domain-containing protein [Opitutaceae bacterium]|jgi:DNA-binding LacI/PurR family transcriptional regulator